MIMNEYDVTVSLECYYRISAPDEETAIEIAYEYFDEAEPTVEINLVKDKVV